MNQKTTISYVQPLLLSIGLKQASSQLPELIFAAEKQAAASRQFLLSVLETELKKRAEKRRSRNYAGAHFPPVVDPIDEFATSELESRITPQR